jgi:hypothetical protein
MKLPDDIATLLKKHKAKWYPTGSRFTCDPPPIDTDEDYLVHTKDKDYLKLAEELEEVGFEWDHGEGYDNDGNSVFCSYHRGVYNLIISNDEDFTLKHIAATHVCKTLNLLKKEERIMVFQAVLYSNQYLCEGGLSTVEDLIVPY